MNSSIFWWNSAYHSILIWLLFSDLCSTMNKAIQEHCLCHMPPKSILAPHSNGLSPSQIMFWETFRSISDYVLMDTQVYLRSTLWGTLRSISDHVLRDNQVYLSLHFKKREKVKQKYTDLFAPPWPFNLYLVSAFSTLPFWLPCK